MFEGMDIDSLIDTIIEARKESEKTQNQEGRGLQQRLFTINVENKYGKKVKFSSDKSTFEVVSAGSGNPQSTETGNSNNKSSYINKNLVFLILLFML